MTLGSEEVLLLRPGVAPREVFLSDSCPEYLSAGPYEHRIL